MYKISTALFLISALCSFGFDSNADDTTSAPPTCIGIPSTDPINCPDGTSVSPPERPGPTAGSISLLGDSVSGWERDYKRLVLILTANSSVGDCELSVANRGEPGSPESFTLTIKKNAGTPMLFDIDSPQATMGRTRVSFDGEFRQSLYSSSDIVGWVNLLLQLNQDGQAIVGLKLYKSFPNGQIYDVGVVCGNLK